MFLEVALPLPLRQTFYYRCSLPQFDQAQLGQRVLVPFKNRQLTGYVVKKHSQVDSGRFLGETKIKAILDIFDGGALVSLELLKLAEWVADYYFAPLGEVLKSCLPPKFNLRSKRNFAITSLGLAVLCDATRASSLSPEERTVLQAASRSRRLDLHAPKNSARYKINEGILRRLIARNWIQEEQVIEPRVLSEKRQLAVCLTEEYQKTLRREGLKPLQRSIIRILEDSKRQILVAELQRGLKISYSTLRSLERKGIVSLRTIPVRRDPLASSSFGQVNEGRILTHEQEQALLELQSYAQSSSFVPVLLHGVTGSGKTEIYLRLIERTLRNQQDSLVLIPEIGLTPRVAQEFRSCLGHNVAILHSGLSHGERFDEWWRIKRGQARVVIGTRSAVFAPLENLKLIVVDEEHDSSYKQQESPRYHARDVALVRGKASDALVVLGSATPAVETFYNARQGKYKYLHLPFRVRSRPLPEVKLVDMRIDFLESKERSPLSAVLTRALQGRLDRKEQSLILLNRRGFAAALLCRSCGQSIQCRNCSISLTYHHARDILLCHYCGYSQKAPKGCPRCGSEYLYFLGEGTEKVETLLKKLFPSARVARLDRDSVQKKNAHAKILNQFQKQEIDILLGTQMISKGHDFPNVTLVGILSADHTLAFPDFHAAERTFQLLSQMSGRAGRGDLAGEVLIQTYYPEHYCLKVVATHDYVGFYEKEIRFRRFMHYPPFSALANILVRDKSLHAAVEAINLFNKLLVQHAESDIKILGPTQSPLAKLKLEHRFQLIIKSKSRTQLKTALKESLQLGAKAGLELRNVHIDVDPVSLM